MNNIKTLSDLCSWLKQNSSGGYRPSTEAAIVIEALAAKAGMSMETSIFDPIFVPVTTIDQKPSTITEDVLSLIGDLRISLYDLVCHAKARMIPDALHLSIAKDAIKSADAFYDQQRTSI